MKYYIFEVRLIGRLDPIEVIAIDYQAAEADILEAYANAEVQTIYRKRAI